MGQGRFCLFCVTKQLVDSPVVSLELHLKGVCMHVAAKARVALRACFGMPAILAVRLNAAASFNLV